MHLGIVEAELEKEQVIQFEGQGIHEEFNGEVVYEVVEVDKEEQFDVQVLVGVKK